MLWSAHLRTDKPLFSEGFHFFCKESAEEESFEATDEDNEINEKPTVKALNDTSTSTPKSAPTESAPPSTASPPQGNAEVITPPPVKMVPKSVTPSPVSDPGF